MPSKMRIAHTTPFFKTHFYVEVKSDEESHEKVKGDLLWALIFQLYNWKAKACNFSLELREWSPLKNGDKLISTDLRNTLRSYYHKSEEVNEEAWTCVLTEKKNQPTGEIPRSWITQIGFVKEPESERWHFSLVLSYKDDVANYMGTMQAAPIHTVPQIAKLILGHKFLTCSTKNGELIPSKPQILRKGDEQSLWEAICNPARTLPYVVINSSLSTQKPMLDATKVADTLLGNAKVFYLEEPNFVTDFNSYYAPEAYRLDYRMGLRVYMPDINTNDPSDSKRHRFIDPSSVSSRVTVPMLRRAFASVPTVSELNEDFFGVEDCFELQRIARRRRLQNQVHETVEDLNAAHELLDEHGELEERYQNLTEDFYELKEEKENLLARLDSQKMQIDGLLSRQGDGNRVSLFFDQEVIDKFSLRDQRNVSFLREQIMNKLSIPLNNIDEIIAFFRTFFSERIAFTDKVIKRARKDCTLSAEQVWTVFYHLTTSAWHYKYEERRPDIERLMQSHCKCTGSNRNFTLHESSTTMKDTKLRQQFKCEYQGEEFNTAPHWTFPHDKQSIHFAFVESKRLIVVAYCGEHLDNAATRKMS